MEGNAKEMQGNENGEIECAGESKTPAPTCNDDKLQSSSSVLDHEGKRSSPRVPSQHAQIPRVIGSPKQNPCRKIKIEPQNMERYTSDGQKVKTSPLSSSFSFSSLIFRVPGVFVRAAAG